MGCLERLGTYDQTKSGKAQATGQAKKPKDIITAFARVEPKIRETWDGLKEKLGREGKLARKDWLTLLGLGRMAAFYDVGGCYSVAEVPFPPTKGSSINTHPDGVTIIANAKDISPWDIRHGIEPERTRFDFTHAEILQRAQELKAEFERKD